MIFSFRALCCFAFVETAYTVDESMPAVNVCVNLTQPSKDILDETVNVYVIDNSRSVYIPSGAPLASKTLPKFNSTKVQNPRRNSYAGPGCRHLHQYTTALSVTHARISLLHASNQQRSIRKEYGK